MGVLLNKNARDILTIGFGGGETTACLALNKLNRLDCVEISPEVVQIALKFFKHINLGDKLDRNVNMIYNEYNHTNQDDLFTSLQIQKQKSNQYLYLNPKQEREMNS